MPRSANMPIYFHDLTLAFMICVTICFGCCRHERRCVLYRGWRRTFFGRGGCAVSVRFQVRWSCNRGRHVRFVKKNQKNKTATPAQYRWRWWWWSFIYWIKLTTTSGRNYIKKNRYHHSVSKLAMSLHNIYIKNHYGCLHTVGFWGEPKKNIE